MHRAAESAGLRSVVHVCNAKVPVVKCETQHGLDVDVVSSAHQLSFPSTFSLKLKGAHLTQVLNNGGAVRKSLFIRQLVASTPLFGQLTRLVKEWARSAGLQDIPTESVNSCEFATLFPSEFFVTSTSLKVYDRRGADADGHSLPPTRGGPSR